MPSTPRGWIARGSLDGADTVEMQRMHSPKRPSIASQRSELSSVAQAVIDLWRKGTITDQTLADAEREIDLEDLMFDARAASGT